MHHFDSVEKILDFTISEEEAAADFYHHLSQTVEQPRMRQVFEDFAAEEIVHKQKLLLVKERALTLPARDTVVDLRPRFPRSMQPAAQTQEYQDALLLAMEREKAAFKLYTDLAALLEEPELREILLALAQEEAKHKVRFEIEYEKAVHAT